MPRADPWPTDACHGSPPHLSRSPWRRLGRLAPPLSTPPRHGGTGSSHPRPARYSSGSGSGCSAVKIESKLPTALSALVKSALVRPTARRGVPAPCAPRLGVISKPRVARNRRAGGPPSRGRGARPSPGQRHPEDLLPCADEGTASAAVTSAPRSAASPRARTPRRPRPPGGSRRGSARSPRRCPAASAASRCGSSAPRPTARPQRSGCR